MSELVPNNSTPVISKPRPRSHSNAVLDRSRVFIAGLLSFMDLITNIFVIILWIFNRNYTITIISGIFIILTSFIEFRASPPEKKCLQLFYLCHLGVYYECFNSLFKSQGRATLYFKNLRLLEIILRALPMIILQLFYYEYIYSNEFNWGNIPIIILLLSIIMSALSFSFWMENYYKDRMRDKYV